MIDIPLSPHRPSLMIERNEINRDIDQQKFPLTNVYHYEIKVS
jgi:hypothetical protein